MARHSLDFWLTSEDLPNPDNRVTLDKDGFVTVEARADGTVEIDSPVPVVRNDAAGRND